MIMLLCLEQSYKAIVCPNCTIIMYSKKKENVKTFSLTLSQTSPCFYVSENTAGKGEIAYKEQFLIFPSVFYPFGELSAIFSEL